jgi:hypothetical protein
MSTKQAFAALSLHDNWYYHASVFACPKREMGSGSSISANPELVSWPHPPPRHQRAFTSAPYRYSTVANSGWSVKPRQLGQVLVGVNSWSNEPISTAHPSLPAFLIAIEPFFSVTST